MRPLTWNEVVGKDLFREYLGLQKRYDRRVKFALRDAAIEMEKLLRTLPSKTFSQGIRIAQYQVRQAILLGVIDQLWQDVHEDIVRLMREAATIGGRGTTRLANVFVNSVEGSDALLAGFRASAERSVANVQARFINSIDLSPRVYKNSAYTRRSVDQAINTGIISGKSAKEIAIDVRRHISPTTPGGVSFAAMRLGRTELNNAFHTVQNGSYADQDWIRGVQWRTSGSHPRLDECDIYAKVNHIGEGPGVFDKRRVPRKPHPQCLCHTIAITITRDQFIDGLFAGRFGAL